MKDNNCKNEVTGSLARVLKFWLLLIACSVIGLNGYAQLGPVAVTGFNNDLVASGVGPGTALSMPGVSNPTIGVDGGGFTFIDNTYKWQAANALPTCNMPVSGLAASAQTSGLTYSFQSYSALNALTIDNNSTTYVSANSLLFSNTGTLALATPASYTKLYVLFESIVYVSPLTVNVVVTFTDASTQTFTSANGNLPNWFDNTLVAFTNVARAQNVSPGLGSTCPTAPNFFEMPLVLNPANYGKQVQSINFTIPTVLSSGTTPTNVNYFHAMAVGGLSPCAVPTFQPTLLTQGASSTSQIGASFTAATGSPSGYLTVQYPNGATPSSLPADGTTYTAGQALGNGTVVQSSGALSFTATGLSGGTQYDFYTYSYNTGVTCGGPVYLTTSPLTGTFSTNACGTMTGTIPVGPTAPASPNGFPSLTAAMAYINVNGLGGNTILELQTDYNVSAEGGAFPITFPLNPCVGVSRTLTVRPASGVVTPIVITGSNATAIFDLNGASYVTIDGRPGGTGSAKMISIVNTSTALTISTIRLINDANNNLITYCDVQGASIVSANPATSGVIFIGSTTGANGNDNNTISFCDVHGAGASLPAIGIGANNATAVGTPANNDNNTITGCNVYDFFIAAGNSTGIKIDQGNNNYTITNNHIYQTASRAATTATSFKFLWLNSNFTSANVTYGSGNTITGNYFGGTNAAGTGVMTVTSNSTSTFAGMDILVGNGAATIVDNNTITNISFTSSNNNTGAGQFSGITVGYGNVSSISGNTIGASGSGITVVSTSTSLNSLAIGIRIGGGIMTNTINNNQVGNINCNMTTNSQAHSVYGIFANGGTTTLNVTNNNIGPLTSGTTTTTATGAAQVIGIGTSVTNVTPVITGNTIHDLSNYAPNSTTTGTGISIIGINLNGPSINSAITVSGNTIYNLRNTAVTTSVSFAPQVQGVYISTALASVITANANNIHSFSVPNWTPSGTATGVPVFAGINIVTGATSTLTNNIIRLGVDGNGTSVTQPVSFRGIYKTATTGTMNAYHNSVYIGGTGVSASTAATQGAAFFRTGTATADDIRNNIFANMRENATTGIKNYAIYLGANTALTLNYNVYYNSGSPTNFFAFNGSDISLYTPSWVTGDANSWNQNPQFINPAGTSATVDLHINPAAATPVEGLGINIPSVTLDFDGLTRSGLTPVDIGAYAGNFTALSACVTPGDQPTALVLTPASISQINGSFTAAASVPDAYIVVKYNTGATPTAPVNGASYVAGNTLGSGINTGTILSAGAATTFSATGLFGGTAYDFYVYAYNKNCTGGPLYNLITPLSGTQSTSSCAGLSGIIQVGPTAPASPAGFPTLTAALAYLNINGLGASTVLELQGNYVSTSETFPIVIGNIQCASPAKTLTLRPAGSVVTPLIITSASTTATIDINGGMYVTIDGRPGGSGTNKYLIVENTSSTAVSAGNAILMRNEASLDTVTYCEVRSANANLPLSAAVPTIGSIPGAIVIGTTTGSLGNDNNVISFCNVHSLAPGGNLGVCIYAGNTTVAGTPANNDNNTIDNCNIYDFYLTTSASAGINIGLGNNNWTITNNHVYQQNTANYGAGTQIVRGIWVTPNVASLTSASGFNISGNYIGGNAANGTGTYTMTGTAGYTFFGVDISVGLGAATSIQNNTFTNFNMTTANTAVTAFMGINIANGNVNCGTTTGNLIGSKTANGSITFTTTANLGGVTGIRAIGGSTVNIANNTISGIDLLGSTTAVTPIFSGITASGGTTINITNDTIGSATLANSINASTASVSTTAQTIKGITVSGGTTSVVSGNFISNMNTNIVATGSQGTTMNGIQVSLSTSTVTGNTITNLTSASQTTATGSLSPIVGIAYTATTAPAVISGNNIHSLKLTSPSTSAAILLTGIAFAGPTTGANSVSGNNIHNLSLSALNNSAIITGINAFGGAATYSNNMVSLGYDETGASVTAGVQFKGIVKGIGLVNNFYFNSVFIGGSNVNVSGVNSYAFQRNTAPGSGVNDIIENNILVNNRSNATTGGKHYAMYLATATFLTLDYNDYYGNGNGYVFGFNAADVPAYVSNWFAGDAHSYEFDPLFINPAGNAATTDLHINPVTPTIVEASGLNIGSITTDFDGQTRSALTPTDIGADAGNFAGLFCTGTPDSANAYLLNASPICGSGSKTIALNGFGSTPGLAYQWQESVTGLAGSFTDVTTGSGGASNTYNTPVLTSSIYYQCRINCINSTDTIYSNILQVVVNPSPALTVTPLTGSNVCSNSKVDLTASGASSYSWAVNPGVTGYPIVSLLTSVNNIPTVTSVPTDSLSSNTANPPSKVSTHVWTYTVTGTSAAGCTSTASTVLNVIPSATPLTITYSTTPASVCAPGTPVTLTVNNPGSIGAGQWTYNWYDNTGNTLLQSTTNTASTNSYTPSTPAVDGEYRNVVKVSNSICPVSYAAATTSYFVGYTTTESVTNSNCGDNGIVKVFPEGQNSYSNWYVNDFTTGLLGAGTIDNSYTSPSFNMFTGGVCVLTPAVNSTIGAFLIRNPNQINTNNLQIDYTVSTSPMGFAFNILGGGAYAWSYASDVWQGTLTPSTGGFNAENGSGSGIKIAFDGTGNTTENAPGAYLMYNCQTIDQGPTSPGVIAFTPGNWWLGLVNAPVSITISETGKLTLKVNNMIVFDHVQLPAAYLAANKSTWMHTFTARTGGANLYNPIDDLKIRYNSYQYSLNSTTGLNGTWQSSNTFSGLAAGTYPVWVRNPSDTTCFAKTDSATVGVNPSPTSANAIAAPGFNTTVCVGSVTKLTTDVAVPGAIFLWEESSAIGGPYIPAAGTNNQANYTTPGLASSTYYRCTFTCPAGSPITSTPIQVVVNIGSVASTNSPQLISCQGGSATLTANPGPNTTIVWYANPTGGTALTTGNSLTVTPATLPAIYYVEPATTVFTNHFDNGGVSVTGNGLGSVLTGSAISTRFTTSGAIRIDSIKVMPGATGTLVVALQNSGSATNIATYSMSVTTTGSFINVPVNFIVNGSGSYQLTTTGPVCAFYSPFNGSYAAPYMFMGGVMTITGAASTPTGGSSTALYGTAFNWSITTSCPVGSGTRVPVQVNVDPSTIISVSPVTSQLCQGGISQLTASSAAAYNTYTWLPVAGLYTDAAATIPYTTGMSASSVYAKPLAPTQYVVTGTVTSGPNLGCSNIAKAIVDVSPSPAPPNILSAGTIVCSGTSKELTAQSTTLTSFVISGTSPSTTASIPNPFYRGFEGAHQQYLIRASELTAAGILSGGLTSVSFNVTSIFPNNTQSAFTVKAGFTTAADLSAGWVPALPVVSGPTDISSVVGANTFLFNSPVIWDGFSNLVIEICWDNDPANTCTSGAPVCYGSTSTGSVATAPFAAATRYYYGDNNTGLRDLCSSTLLTGTTQTRPVMTLGYGNAVAFEWSPATGLNVTTGASVIASPSVATVYTVTASNVSGCSTTTSIALTVTATPEPFMQEGDSVLCSNDMGFYMHVLDNNAYSGGYPAGTNFDFYGAGGILYQSGPDNSFFNANNSDAFYVAVTLPGYLGGCNALTDTSVMDFGTSQAPQYMLTTDSVKCYGESNGKAIAEIIFGGTPRFRWQWYNSSSVLVRDTTSETLSDTLSGMPEGMYTFVLTDHQDSLVSPYCSVTDSIYIGQPDAPLSATEITASHVDLLCNGDSNGAAEIAASGGTPDYFYNWSNGETTSNISGLTAGDYTCTITDLHGCSSTLSVTITEPAAIVLNCTATNASCFGSNDGTVSVSATGGTNSYSYLWSNGATTDTQGSLSPGTYTVTVTDDHGCSQECTSTVSQSAPFTVTITGNTAICQGGTSVLDAGAGYTAYSWSTGATTRTITVSTAATYSVTATNAGGCTGSASVTTTVNPKPVPAISGANVVCSTATTTITASAGFTTYSWSTGATTQAITVGAGTYTVTVTNASGCTGTASKTITLSSGGGPAQPGAITGSTAVCKNSDAGYSIVAVAGANDYTWTATGGATISSGQGTTAVVVHFSNTAVASTLSVVANNLCGTSAARTLSYTVSAAIPAAPSTITGTFNGVCGKTLSYTCPTVTNASSYLWTVPTGATIMSGQGTTTVSVKFNAAFTGTGNITVAAQSGCGSSAATSRSLEAKPGQPVITGLNYACQYQTGMTYSITPVAGATSYIWTVVAGSTIVSGQGTTSIVVNWGSINGVISCKATNGCGNSIAGQKPVSFTCREAGNDLFDFSDVSLYPNPASTAATVQFEAYEEGNGQLYIYDLTGREVFKQNIAVSSGNNQIAIDLNAYRKGSYIVKVVYNGNTRNCKLIVD